jgi:hypothetical protein
MRALADASRLRRFFRELARATNEETTVYVTIEPQLYRYPHIDPKSFAVRVEAILRRLP